jgi:MFS superfamily sulfate permease-like transporter
VLRLGFIDVVLSRALLRGFITAVAVIIMMYVAVVRFELSPAHHVNAREQLIPMLGLTTLYRSLHPHSTLDKIDFLLTYTWSHTHIHTARISFGALVILMSMRWIKGKFSNHSYIYRLPEVLIVVVVSTSEWYVSKEDMNSFYCLQLSPESSDGTGTA